MYKSELILCLAVSLHLTGKTVSQQTRDARVNLISFDPIGNDVGMGLDFEMPFMKVPMTLQADKSGNSQALLSLNTGAVAVTVVLAGGGIIVGHLLRRVGLQYPAPATPAQNNTVLHGAETASSGHQAYRRSYEMDVDQKYAKLFDSFKFIYTNGSGARTATTLPNLLSTLENSFLENNIDLAACLEKSICALVRKSSEKMRSGNATGLQKIIDGLSNWSWFREFMQQSILGEAIETGKSLPFSDQSSLCDVKYTKCKWDAPDEKLLHLLTNHVKFS